MAIREIVKEGNDCLRKVCRPVEKFDERLAILLDDMAETMYEGNGVGLAAPQVGVLRRVVVIDCGDRLYELINPEIIAQAGALDEAEGCLSVRLEPHASRMLAVSRPDGLRLLDANLRINGIRLLPEEGRMLLETDYGMEQAELRFHPLPREIRLDGRVLPFRPEGETAVLDIPAKGQLTVCF